jgi:hypothetical protein
LDDADARNWSPKMVCYERGDALDALDALWPAVEEPRAGRLEFQLTAVPSISCCVRLC